MIIIEKNKIWQNRDQSGKFGIYSFCLYGNQLTGWSSKVINFLCAGIVCCFSRPAKKK